jgi:hypothetical protein
VRGPALISHPSPQSLVNRRQKLCRAPRERGHDLCLPQGYALPLAIGITIDFALIVGMMFHRAVRFCYTVDSVVTMLRTLS